MTYSYDCTLQHEFLEQIACQGCEYAPEFIPILINAAMQAERQKYLGIGPYEQSDNRQSYANNFKPKTVQTADLNNWQLVDQIYREVKWAQCPV